VWLHLIDQLPAIIAASAGIVAAILSYRANRNAKAATVQSAANSDAIEVVRTDVNDKMQQLVNTTAKASHAEGMKEEADQQSARDHQKPHEFPMVTDDRNSEG
jgi:hypothetical protein